MAGARQIAGAPVSFAEAGAVALDAGCDLVLLCNQSAGASDVIDVWLAGLERARADGLWHADPDSEARRRALLPRSAPLAWDDLMHHPAYQHALERLP
jgi:beta-N-acetylhexosaminidase